MYLYFDAVWYNTESFSLFTMLAQSVVVQEISRLGVRGAERPKAARI